MTRYIGRGARLDGRAPSSWRFVAGAVGIAALVFAFVFVVGIANGR